MPSRLLLSGPGNDARSRIAVRSNGVCAVPQTISGQFGSTSELEAQVRAARAGRPPLGPPPYRVRSTVQPLGIHRPQQQQQKAQQQRQPPPCDEPPMNGTASGACMVAQGPASHWGWMYRPASWYAKHVGLQDKVARFDSGGSRMLTTVYVPPVGLASHAAPPQQEPVVPDAGSSTSDRPAEVCICLLQG